MVTTSAMAATCPMLGNAMSPFIRRAFQIARSCAGIDRSGAARSKIHLCAGQRRHAGQQKGDTKHFFHGVGPGKCSTIMPGENWHRCLHCTQAMRSGQPHYPLQSAVRTAPRDSASPRSGARSSRWLPETDSSAALPDTAASARSWQIRPPA